MRGAGGYGPLKWVATVVATAALTVGAGALASAQPLPPPPGPPAPVVPGTPCTATARACADLIGLRAWLFEDGRIVRGPVSISIGDEGEDATPPGRYGVEWKNRDHVSGETGGPMPYAVFFAPGGIAFHEGNLQTRSRGCIRLAHDDAVAFFDFLQVGDEVQVHSDPPGA